jgi:hypothetical protein
VSYQAWREFMILAHDYLKLPPAPFVRPDSVVEREVCTPSGKLATDLCPRHLRQKALFAAETLQEPNPIALKDDWWQPSAGGVRLVVPPQLQYWGGFGAWAGRAAGGAPAPAAPAAPGARPPAPAVSPTPQPSRPAAAPTLPAAPTATATTSAPSPEATTPPPTQSPVEPASTARPQATRDGAPGPRAQ